MHATRGKRRGCGALIGVLCLLVLPGCGGTDVLGIGAELGSGFGIGARSRVAESEGNDSFDTPTALPLVADQPLRINGDVDDTGDVDVYDLGPVRAGDRLIVDVSSGAWLDAAAAVFDGDADLLYLNDDRNYFARMVDPYIDFVVQRDVDPCYVTVATSPTSRSAGAYTLSISRLPTADAATNARIDQLPLPRPQTVLLNFDGASSVAFGGRSAVDIAPFDAAAISPELEGDTDRLIELILARVREDYEGLNVEFHTSREIADLGPDVSTIHFGAYDPALLGVAESVDEFNESPVQEAIVFTDTFSVFSALDPTIEEYATALANVASHETGHLLGLVHTADVYSIMDITATLRELLANQAFRRAPLDSSTFPVGYQDAGLTLVEAVGGDLATVRHNSATQLTAAEVSRRAKRTGLPDGPRVRFSSCGSVMGNGRRSKQADAVP